MSNHTFSIDEQAGTITFTTDLDTNEQETFSLSEYSEVLYWLLKRQDELRYLSFIS